MIFKSHDQSVSVIGSVNTTQEDIAKLPDFYQPTAKKDFAQRVGESLDDLGAQVKQLGLWLNNLEASWKRKDGSSVSVMGGRLSRCMPRERRRCENMPSI